MITMDQLGKEMIAINKIFATLVKNCILQYATKSTNEISHLIVSNNPSFDPLDPNSKIMSLGTVESDGKTIFDALFALKDPHGSEEINQFVNVEIQGRRDADEIQKKRENVYLARMIWEQKNAIEKMAYGKIVNVASVWVYPKTRKKQKGKITIEARVTFDYTEGRLIETNEEVDFSMAIISVQLGESENQLIQMLNLVFDTENVEVNAKILEERYGIKLERELKEMCTLDEYRISVGEERGLAQGLAQGLEKGLAQGLDEGIVLSLKNLMNSLSISLVEAMNLLKISAEDCI